MIAGEAQRGVQFQTVWLANEWLFSQGKEVSEGACCRFTCAYHLASCSSSEGGFSPMCVEVPRFASKDL